MIKASSNKVILAVDIRKYIVDGKLARASRQIRLTELFCRKFRKVGLVLHSSQSIQIDGAQSTDSIIPKTVSILPCKFSAANYRVILVDFDIDKLIGRRAKVCSLSMRRLAYKNQLTVNSYNLRVIELIKFHNIKERLDNIELLWDSINKDLRTVRIDISDD